MRAAGYIFQALRAGLENQLPAISKIPCVSPRPLFNLQSKKRAWIVGKEHYDLGNDLFSRMLDPSCNIPAPTGKRRDA
jgi:cyclopropane-fatty-acyl-phospholipid synthase